ncbi:phosphopantetheine-binding protein [Alteromonas flava]|uniref:phosphopantetheine-binding protein n=1 Tax=Alteromonas flava TaxID=2048003 RepID=UPI000C28693F|nr:phosphopantetheine-binding protein [Alteromonas flava]
MTQQTEAELKMANVLVDALNLEDIEPEEINPEEPLFDGGLELDSIDALEIAVAISQEYGVKLKAEDESTREAFATLRSLTQYVENHQ